MVYELLLSMQDRSDDVYTGAVCLVQNIHVQALMLSFSPCCAFLSSCVLQRAAISFLACLVRCAPNPFTLGVSLALGDVISF